MAYVHDVVGREIEKESPIFQSVARQSPSHDIIL